MGGKTLYKVAGATLSADQVFKAYVKTRPALQTVMQTVGQWGSQGLAKVKHLDASLDQAVGKVIGKVRGKAQSSVAREAGSTTGQVSSNVNPQNVALHERYRDDLIRNMEKPHVKDPDLKKIVEGLYRPNARVGSGSTAAALRSEIRTGEPVGGKFHREKAEQRIRNLRDWIKTRAENANLSINEQAKRAMKPHPSSQDMQTAKNLLRDLEAAFNGK